LKVGPFKALQWKKHRKKKIENLKKIIANKSLHFQGST